MDEHMEHWMNKQYIERLLTTFPPYCSFGGGRTRPVTVTILVSTLIPKSLTYGSPLKLARATYREDWALIRITVNNGKYTNLFISVSLSGAVLDVAFIIRDV